MSCVSIKPDDLLYNSSHQLQATFLPPDISGSGELGKRNLQGCLINQPQLQLLLNHIFKAAPPLSSVISTGAWTLAGTGCNGSRRGRRARRVRNSRGLILEPGTGGTGGREEDAETESACVHVTCACRGAAHLQRLSTFPERVGLLSPEGCRGGEGCVT